MKPAMHRIFEVPEKNVEHIKQTQGLVEAFPGYVLRMRGLPYSATPDDVVSFFPCNSVAALLSERWTTQCFMSTLVRGARCSSVV